MSSFSMISFMVRFLFGCSSVPRRGARRVHFGFDEHRSRSFALGTCGFGFRHTSREPVPRAFRGARNLRHEGRFVKLRAPKTAAFRPSAAAWWRRARRVWAWRRRVGFRRFCLGFRRFELIFGLGFSGSHRALWLGGFRNRPARRGLGIWRGRRLGLLGLDRFG